MEQIDLFSYTIPKLKIDKPIRLIEMFAGIGSQAKALKNLGANFENWKVVEFDRHAIDSYNAIHETNFTTKDITQTHATDLEIVERELLLCSHIFLPLPRPFSCWTWQGYAEGKRNEIGTPMGSGEDTG